ncbi:DUF1934 domain-containing protein [Sporosarcina koreensis]|uniref:DUF1934 domain-containing protein n=1 Tax=Sporosarcina koreensis TaxID=334735 RepID=UPI0006934632|nr:DUF1934 domain-containing protein [Sporosarcina koreensis]
MGTQPPIVPVTINLKSEIRHPGQDTDFMELELAGTITEKGGRRYLRYEEKQNAETVRTTIKLDPEDAVIMRTGAIRMRLPFAPGGTRPGTYANGPLALDLHVVTNELLLTEDHDRGEFRVSYDMHAEDGLLGHYELTITYAEGTR